MTLAPLYATPQTDAETSTNTNTETPANGSLRYGSHPTPLAYSTDSPGYAITAGDHIFERRVHDTRTTFGVTEVLAEYQRRVVIDTELTSDPLTDGRSWQYTFAYRDPATEELAKRLLEPTDTTVYSSPPPRMPDFPRTDHETVPPTPETHEQPSAPRVSPDWRTTRWECIPETPPKLTKSPKTLTFTRVDGTGSRHFVNRLLAGGPDGKFNHILPGVQKWKFAFVATHDSHPYSVAVIAQPYNSDTGKGTGENVVYLTRLCNHPHAPHNTSSWMLGRVRGWLTHNTTVNRLVAIAGIDNNDGTCYEAAGFSYDGCSTGTTRWGEDWTRHRWVWDFTGSQPPSQAQLNEFAGGD